MNVCWLNSLLLINDVSRYSIIVPRLELANASVNYKDEQQQMTTSRDPYVAMVASAAARTDAMPPITAHMREPWGTSSAASSARGGVGGGGAGGGYIETASSYASSARDRSARGADQQRDDDDNEYDDADFLHGGNAGSGANALSSTNNNNADAAGVLGLLRHAVNGIFVRL